MLAKISEKTVHKIRFLLLIGWVVLIISFFYDPISITFTNPSNAASPFRLTQELFSVEGCVKVQEKCLVEQPYAMGARIWWAMIVPCSIVIIFVLGHEFWRRICPLSFVSQLPTALGIKRRRKITNRRTGKTYYKSVIIKDDSWLGRNHLYVQFTFFFLGLAGRILYTNSDRLVLGIFLILTILAALVVGYLYEGKSWCNYFCPMAPVQIVYTGPRGLLGIQAHREPKQKITQSMCRTLDNSDREVNACTGCKSFCIDIDAERNYWEELKKPGRRLVQYGYLGIVFAFYFYYFAYSGNWRYYFSGAWTHEENQLKSVFSPGFYLFDQSIPIPKFIAVNITFALFVGIAYLFCFGLEKAYIAYKRKFSNPISGEQAQHIIFTISTVASFWIFFCYGARPNLNLLPHLLLMGFNSFIVLVGSLWLYRTFKRDRKQYNRERLAGSLRRQLERLDIDFSQFLQGRSLKELNSDELYILAKVLPGATQQDRRKVYIDVVKETLIKDNTSVMNNTEVFKTLRQAIGLKDEEHYEILNRFLKDKSLVEI